MELATSITQFKAAENATKVQYAVAAKVLKMADAQGAAIVQLLDAAGKNFGDAMSGLQAAIDPSRVLDVYA